MSEETHKYAYMFDKEWCKSKGYHIPELSEEQKNYFGYLLEINGFVTMNEVKRAVGEVETIEGSMYGWVI